MISALIVRLAGIREVRVMTTYIKDLSKSAHKMAAKLFELPCGLAEGETFYMATACDALFDELIIFL
jgi:hypothetical protein